MISSLNKDKCIGCGTCVEICPMDVFRMNPSSRQAEIAYSEDCQTCYQCELECPITAIEVDPLRGVARPN